MRWLDRLLMAELVVLTALLGCFLDKDMDIWWHLRAGREILAGRGIPRTDAYIFALPGAEWIDLHWGFQVAAAWIFQHGGFVALTAAAAIVAGIAIALALAATAHERSAVAVVWCWLPAVFVISSRFYPRPEVVSLACLAGYLLVIQIAERRPRALWLLVPIQLVWVNVQGLFVLGPIILACWLLDRALEDRGPDACRRWRARWTVAVAVAMACLANPYTWKGAVFPLTLFRRMSAERGFYGQHIGELMSLPDLVARTGITSVYLRIALLLLVATVASFGLRRMRSRHFYFRSLVFVLFAGLGLLASRNQPQFALIAGALLAWNVGDWLATRPPAPLVERAITRIVTSAVLVGLMFWVASGRFYAYAGEGRIAGLGQHPLWYAHDAARFAAHDDMPRYFIAYHEGQAAVLEFHMRPDQKVFVDPRLEVSPRHALQQYYDLATDMIRRQSSWPERLRGFPRPLGFLVDHLSYHAVEAALLVDDDWRCIWFDAVAGVYVPRTETRLVDQHLVDFGSRYFAGKYPTESRTATGTAAVSVASLTKEAQSLFNVGRDLLAGGPAGQSLGRVFMLLAASNARAVLERVPRSPSLTQLLANVSLSLYPAPARETPVAGSLEILLGVARARYLLNRAVQQAPTDFQSWLALFGIAQALGDLDALWAAGTRLADLYATDAAEFEFQRRVRVMLRHLIVVRGAEAPLALPVDAADVLATARELVDRHRHLGALDFVERSFRDGVGLPAPSVDLLDLRATLFLIAGDPGRARTVWTELAATSGAPASLITRRLANTAFVEGSLSEAVDAYRASLASDPARSAVRYGLAISHLERGDTADFVRECRTAMRSGDLPEGPADFCRQMAAVAERSDGRPQRPADARGDRR
jgi:hypothetical protein